MIGALGVPEAAVIAADALAEDLVAAEAEEALTMLGPIGDRRADRARAAPAPRRSARCASSCSAGSGPDRASLR